ncbi:transglutaminase family protein [Paenibacillus sp. H1-7]|uniref:transglutaminase-like domain-containing protein n=1 Tax=Paenibacillus sp. H1-7 TaxID=2282849 RepID=UPI001EF7C0AB|nr:transglutaminase family protein [Paenibacillus sp. H1-7]ULL18917.1 transglutaminase family protein [Paenibacillus sp. H1-7]
MKLVCESNQLIDYLPHSDVIDYHHPRIHDTARSITSRLTDEQAIVKAVFEFVRDEIAHSWDIQSRQVTRSASEVLEHGHGICYAKSNLQAALLRSLNIPAGFCYQRLTIGDTPDTGHCIHALNAVYLSSLQRWIRLDARGNKEGVEAEFSTTEEKLAFPIRLHYDEADYPVIYARPNGKTMDTLARNNDCLIMYQHGLPTEL